MGTVALCYILESGQLPVVRASLETGTVQIVALETSPVRFFLCRLEGHEVEMLQLMVDQRRSLAVRSLVPFERIDHQLRIRKAASTILEGRNPDLRIDRVAGAKERMDRLFVLVESGDDDGIDSDFLFEEIAVISLHRLFDHRLNCLGRSFV